MIVLLILLTFIKSKVVPSIGKFNKRIWCSHFPFSRYNFDSVTESRCLHLPSTASSVKTKHLILTVPAWGLSVIFLKNWRMNMSLKLTTYWKSLQNLKQTMGITRDQAIYLDSQKRFSKKAIEYSSRMKITRIRSGQLKIRFKLQK